LRNINDLDVTCYHLPLNREFYKIIDQSFGRNKKLPFVDLSIKNRFGWRPGGGHEYTIRWFEKTWPELYGARNMTETIFDPKFHYHYNGLKIININADIKRRIRRARPAAYADLIAMQRIIQQPIDISPIPRGHWINNKYEEFNDQIIDQMYVTIKKYLKKRYNINMTIEEIRQLVQFKKNND
jgi:hypothetical protein